MCQPNWRLISSGVGGASSSSWRLSSQSLTACLVGRVVCVMTASRSERAMQKARVHVERAWLLLPVTASGVVGLERLNLPILHAWYGGLVDDGSHLAALVARTPM